MPQEFLIDGRELRALALLFPVRADDGFELGKNTASFGLGEVEMMRRGNTGAPLAEVFSSNFHGLS